ncbi:DNA gyrase inhibitor YacG [Methylococcus geothermalis]|uniref:DNA gyrase inhibitor YacG n=1 Tax=Methylococcus geothermalis TaxID=2681310 RepID=A0A858Q7Y4_9GAMM|nr:DNA gyrase inhibitor YacG [Methylococcus geothermalis]QJD29923.1 DNA gyrase inhibitor YacG [Methylococcus geothermalis]
MSRVYTIVRCPHCGKPVPWTEAQKFKPFCSDRCRLIDLGSWANEDYAIPGESVDSRELPDDRDGGANSPER